MKNYAKRVICLLIAAVLTCNVCMAEEVAAAVGLSGIAAKGAILMGENGEVMFEQNADKPLEPASVTKVMTLLLMMEALEAGTIKLDDLVTASSHAMEMGGSQIYLKEGEQMTVNDMLKSVAVSSANDCAVALAEHLCGTEDAFVAKMNERAAVLELENTYFVNCDGLPAEGHVTSARDIAIMSCELMKHEKIFEYTKIWTDTVRDGAFGLANTNKMLRTYNGMTGLKTGFTSSAGYCLSGTAEREGLKLVAVVLGEVDAKVRSADVAAMLNYGFANYAKINITPDAPIMPVKVMLGKKAQVMCALAPYEALILEKAKIGEIEKEILMQENVAAPVIIGQQLGELRLMAGGEEVARVAIVAQEEIGKLGILDLFMELLRPCALREAA